MNVTGTSRLGDYICHVLNIINVYSIYQYYIVTVVMVMAIICFSACGYYGMVVTFQIVILAMFLFLEIRKLHLYLHTLSGCS